MEKNCHHHIKTETNGRMTTYWRCLDPWQHVIETTKRQIHLCDVHVLSRLRSTEGNETIDYVAAHPERFASLAPIIFGNPNPYHSSVVEALRKLET